MAGRSVRVCIVGAGPRGLSVLERLCAIAPVLGKAAAKRIVGRAALASACSDRAFATRGSEGGSAPGSEKPDVA